LRSILATTPLFYLSVLILRVTGVDYDDRAKYVVRAAGVAPHRTTFIAPNLRLADAVIRLEIQAAQLTGVRQLVFASLPHPETAMKLLPAIAFFTIAATCCVGSLPAQQPTLQARIAARHELELAKIDLRNYWQIEYPRQRRDLNAAIEMTELEIRNYEALEREYRPFTQFTIGAPFPITIQNLEMCHKDAELRLRNLQAERSVLIRFHGERFRVLEMRVQVARQQVADLEANDTIGEAPIVK
jgi:hypothetical protein